MRIRLGARSRGQALAETAIALPVFLIVLYLVIWALQSGVMGERVQLVARYSGMVSNQLNPYDQYSLYAIYSAAGGAPLPNVCVTPPATLLSQGAPLTAPVPNAAPIWTPDPATVAVSTACTRVAESSGNLSATRLLLSDNTSVTAGIDPPPYVAAVVGNTSIFSAGLNQLTSPDMGSVTTCYTTLGQAFLNDTSPPPLSAVITLTPPTSFAAATAVAPALAGSCSN
jgi:hypothetical protein